MNVSEDILIWTGNSNHHKVTASDFQRDIKVLLGSEGESAGFDLGPQNEKLRGSFLGDLKSPLAVFNWEWAVMRHA